MNGQALAPCSRYSIRCTQLIGSREGNHTTLIHT